MIDIGKLFVCQFHPCLDAVREMAAQVRFLVGGSLQIKQGRPGWCGWQSRVCSIHEKFPVVDADGLKTIHPVPVRKIVMRMILDISVQSRLPDIDTIHDRTAIV